MKGLEYRVVAILGCGFMPNARFSEADEVRLAHVAMTRTTERLLLTYDRESPFVRRLIAGGRSRRHSRR
jgi:superfamily I DNA/RNA helicase